MSRYSGSSASRAAVGPDRVLQHADAELLVGDDVEILGLEQLAGLRVGRLEHQCVLVVRHRLGSLDVSGDERRHVATLLDMRDVRRVDTSLGHAGKDLVLVAEPPVADAVAGEVCRRLDPRVGERELQRARTD